MKRRRRPMDWVTNLESWDLTAAPYIFDPFTSIFVGPPAWSMDAPETATMTAHQDLLDQQATAFPQLEQTCLRVVGSILYGGSMFLVDSMPTVNAKIMLDFRLVVGMQQPDSIYSSDIDVTGDYNMLTSYVANDDFMWHHHVEQTLSNSYWSDTSNTVTPDWRAPQKLDVDVTVQRRLKQREAVYLVMQASAQALVQLAGSYVWNPWADYRVWVQPQLRTLVRTNT